jgi:hypothetical protein
VGIDAGRAVGLAGHPVEGGGGGREHPKFEGEGGARREFGAQWRSADGSDPILQRRKPGLGAQGRGGAGKREENGEREGDGARGVVTVMERGEHGRAGQECGVCLRERRGSEGV